MDPQLHCDHQHLKTARETQRRIEQELAQASEQLNVEKSRNSQLAQDVENYRARQKHITDLKHYQAKRPWIVRFSVKWVYKTFFYLIKHLGFLGFGFIAGFFGRAHS